MTETKQDPDSTAKTVIVVTDEHGREHPYAGAGMDLEDGVLLVLANRDDPETVAAYAPGHWLKACDEGAESADVRRQLNTALKALYGIRDLSLSVDRAREVARGAIAEIGAAH